MASTSPAARLWEYVLPDGTVMYGFTPHRVVMPWDLALVKQEEQGLAHHDPPEGTSRDEREATPAARLWEYEFPDGTVMYGFTPHRVVMPWEFAPVKQEEQGLADHDTAARPFASPPVHPQLDRCPPCCACRLPHAPAHGARSFHPLVRSAQGSQTRGTKRKRSDAEVQADLEEKKAKRAEVRAATRCAAR